MATTFEEIRDYVRPLVGDNDASAFRYSDSVLNQHIRLIIIRTDDADIVEDTEANEGEEAFTLTLDNKDKALLAYRVAQSLIVHLPKEFSYRTPVLSVTRKGITQELLSHLEDQIIKLENGGSSIAISSDHFIEALINGTQRFIDEFSAA